MSFALRSYQEDIVDEVRVHMQNGVRSILVQSPTGSGKTALGAKMIGTAAQRGIACLMLVHRRELVRQTIRAFANVGIRHGVIASGFMSDPRQLVQIASVQTYAKRGQRFQRPSLILWDEAHHCIAGSWAAIRRGNPNARHVGFTATPERLDGAGLSDYFDKMVNGPQVGWLIENGHLSPYRLHMPPGMSVAGVHSRRGDFERAELAAAADKPTITGDAIREYKKHCDGQRAVVFCVTVKHSKHVTSQFQAAGIAAAHIDGETDLNERDEILAKFERGDIRVLCNVELFGEGFDLPSIEACILLRPTQSLALHLQQIGRCLRPSPGKEYATILDHAGNCERHGLPDEERTWTLQGRIVKALSERDGGGRKAIKKCQKCWAPQSISRQDCQFCGEKFTVDIRGEQQIAHIDGDLVEVEAGIVRIHRAREQSEAESYDQLVELGKRRGYLHPGAWAQNILKARKKREGSTNV